MDPPDPAERCRLLAGPVAWLSQGVLVLVAVGSLFVKRSLESPKRALVVWAMDVSKQGLGMLVAHICGMVAAIIMARVKFSGVWSSECAWYMFTFLLDTTVGTGLTVLLHWAATRLAASRYSRDQGSGFCGMLVPCGDYGDPPCKERWALQTTEWATCVGVARAACLGVALAAGPLLGRLARALDRAFESRPDLLLVTVMIVGPLSANVIQVLVQDAVLRWKRGAPASPVTGPENERLFDSSLTEEPSLWQLPDVKRPDSRLSHSSEVELGRT